MIEQIYQLGLEKYAGDQGAAKAFTEGFMKQAFTGQGALHALTGNPEFLKGAAGALGKGVIAAGLGTAIYGASALVNSGRNQALRLRADASFQRVAESNQILRNADHAKVKSYFETVFRFAPHVAADPNLLGAILSNAVLGEGIDPMTIKTLVDLEGRTVENAKGALFTPKAFG